MSDKKKKSLAWPDRHYGLNNRTLMAKNRGELHLGQSLEEHAEYVREELPHPDMKQEANKNPTKGNSKG